MQPHRVVSREEWVAAREAGEVFHTYSSYARGNEEVIGAFIYLDLTPNGRNETEIMDWVKRHDEYETADRAQSCCHAAEHA
jgi:predicted dithiol-disulfide oxidoreductase (DUF899 family)